MKLGIYYSLRWKSLANVRHFSIIFFSYYNQSGWRKSYARSTSECANAQFLYHFYLNLFKFSNIVVELATRNHRLCLEPQDFSFNTFQMLVSILCRNIHLNFNASSSIAKCPFLLCVPVPPFLSLLVVLANNTFLFRSVHRVQRCVGMTYYCKCLNNRRFGYCGECNAQSVHCSTNGR